MHIHTPNRRENVSKISLELSENFPVHVELFKVNLTLIQSYSRVASGLRRSYCKITSGVRRS